MEPWIIGKALSPFFLLVVIAFVTRPCRLSIENNMREGFIKRLLLKRVS